jgi:[acyl-carrier-protein] S-malonyltransferase
VKEVTFLFPGQGSQFVGMGASLAQAFPEAARTFEEADDALGLALARIAFQGPESELTMTKNAQPAILTHSVAVLRVLGSRGLVPRAAAGHSLGEYSAYVAAGSLSLADAVRLVRRRGELMFEAGLARPGTMAAVLGMESEVVIALCREVQEGVVAPANFNSPGQVVVSGDPKAVEALLSLARAKGAKRTLLLQVSGAFHSPLMADAAAGLRRALAEIPFRPASIPVIANASAAEVAEPEAIRDSLYRQLSAPVRWEESMRVLLRAPGPPFVEAGPGKVLRGLLRSIDRDAQCGTAGDAVEIEGLVA